MNSNTLTTSGTLGYVSTDWSIAGVGDFDGDGKSDILWRNSTTGQVYLWFISGTAMTGGAKCHLRLLRLGHPGPGRLRRQRPSRHPLAQQHHQQVYIWLMNGATLTSSGSPGAPDNTWQIAP